MEPVKTGKDDASDTAESPEEGGGTAGDVNEFPPGLRWAMIVSILLSVVFLVVAVYQRYGGGAGGGTELARWKKQANAMIDIALNERWEEVPRLLAALDHSNARIRRNAEWALHHLTGLPWAGQPEVCRRWWTSHGEAWMAGKAPSSPPPEPERKFQNLSPEEAGVRTFFRLRSARRVYVSEEPYVISYELGVRNTGEKPFRILSPERLPYRAFRYGADVPDAVQREYNLSRQMARIPVHLRYGPSVANVSLAWFRPSALEQPVRDEFLEFTVLKQIQRTVSPGESLRIRRRFPVLPPDDLLSDQPQAIARLTFARRDLLMERDGTRVRVPIGGRSIMLKLFRRAPKSVPGYTESELSTIKRTAQDHGFELERAERMRVSGISRTSGSNENETGTPPGDTNNAGGQNKNNSPSRPHTIAAGFSDVSKGKLLYDSRLGWGLVKASCRTCRGDQRERNLLSKVRVYTGELSPETRSDTVVEQSNRERWVLVFRARTDASESKPGSD